MIHQQRDPSKQRKTRERAKWRNLGINSTQNLICATFSVSFSYSTGCGWSSSCRTHSVMPKRTRGSSKSLSEKGIFGCAFSILNRAWCRQPPHISGRYAQPQRHERTFAECAGRAKTTTDEQCHYRRNGHDTRIKQQLAPSMPLMPPPSARDCALNTSTLPTFWTHTQHPVSSPREQSSS